MKVEKPYELGQAWPWIGQDAFGEAALNIFQHGYWPATVLWSGPSNLGKGSVARWFVQRDLCQHATVRPCGKCADCQQVTNGTHPECLLLGENQGKALSLEESHELLQRLRWKTSSQTSRNRWVLLVDVESLSEAIGNSILKLIEEPPAQTFILMTSSQPDRIMPTIRSRAIEYRWHRVPHEELDQALSVRFPKIPVTDRRTILRQAAGRPGLAIQLCQHPEILDDRWKTMQLLIQGLQSGRWVQRREWSLEDLNQAEDLIRDALLISAGSQPRRWVQHLDVLQNFSRTLGAERLRQLAKRLEFRHTYLRQHVQPSFILHDLSF